jgi:hypothetical protein
VLDRVLSSLRTLVAGAGSLVLLACLFSSPLLVSPCPCDSPWSIRSEYFTPLAGLPRPRPCPVLSLAAIPWLLICVIKGLKTVFPTNDPWLLGCPRLKLFSIKSWNKVYLAVQLFTIHKSFLCIRKLENKKK